MSIALWVVVGLVAYLIVGIIIASIMKAFDHDMAQHRNEFMVTSVLWPAPLMLWIIEGIIWVIGTPAGYIFDLIEKWKR